MSVKKNQTAPAAWMTGQGISARNMGTAAANIFGAVPPLAYLIVSALLLVIGTLGVLLRRNIVVILMSIELIMNAVNINLAVFSKMHHHAGGQVFVLFVMAVAVAEAAVGLGILIALFRNRGTILADEMDLLKW